MIDVFLNMLNSIEDKKLCVQWIGSKNSSGYGKVRFNGKHVSCHRLAYIKTYGEISENHLICHHCDNRLCFNPYHLFLGTSKDNVNDMMNKGRLNRINNIGNKKLTDNEIIEIKNYDLSEVKVIDIAKKYNIHRTTVYKIRA